MTKKLDLKSATAGISNYRKYRQDFFEKSVGLLSVASRLETDFIKELKRNLELANNITIKFKNSRLGMFDIWRNVGFSADENNLSDGIVSLLNPSGGHKLSTRPIKNILLLLKSRKNIGPTVNNILYKIGKSKISVIREKRESSSKPDIEIFSQDFIIFIEHKLRDKRETFRNKKWQTNRMFLDLEQKAKKLGIQMSNCMAIYLTPEGKRANNGSFICISVNELVNAIKDAVKSSINCPCKESIISFLEYYSKK